MLGDRVKRDATPDPRLMILLVCSWFLVFQTHAARGGEPEKSPKNQDPPNQEDELDHELSTLEDDDFPDLVAVDESGGLMDELAFLEDAGMVELAARHRQLIGMSPSAITVITREDIECSGATVITDLLRLVPGLEVLALSPLFHSVTGRLLWTFENNTHQVRIDDRLVNLEILGYPPWLLLPITLDDIERIEVIRGPGSSLYGTGALAGVISITTRSVKEEPSGMATLEGGEFGSFTAGFRGSTRIEKLGLAASTSFDMMNRWSADPWSRGREAFKARTTAEYRLSDSVRLVLDGGYFHGTGIVSTSAGNIDAQIDVLNLLFKFRSEQLRGSLDWSYTDGGGQMEAPLVFAGVHLADLALAWFYGHTLNGELQWTLPLDWEPLLIIAGTGFRSTWIDSPTSLNEESFSDINSSGYHQVGFDYWEIRLNAFCHAEFTPVDWITITGGLRYDYNTETSGFFSPRLAAVVHPLEGQFFRMGVARSFRKPSFWEKRLHINVEFPEGGIFVGPTQDSFREFMTRVLGNPEMRNEKLWSFEAGYLGQFLDEDLQIGLDLYYSIYQDESEMLSNIVEHDRYLVDLEQSSFMFENLARDLAVFGFEMHLGYRPTGNVFLQAFWSHREVMNLDTGEADDRHPKNMLTLGGRFTTDLGLLGSLYLHARSEFMDRSVDNPKGLMEPLVHMHMENYFLVMAKLGYRWDIGGRVEMESGARLFLPVSPWAGPLFAYREHGGGETPFGVRYGGDLLSRVVSVYLKGSF